LIRALLAAAAIALLFIAVATVRLDAPCWSDGELTCPNGSECFCVHP
jgi:hypothetical protein